MTGRLDNVIYPAVEEKLKKYIQTGKVIVQGDISNVYDMVKNLDIMITTSLWEGLPGIIIEAVSSGVPVIASGIAPNKEVAAKLSGVRIIDGWNVAEWKDVLTTIINELQHTDKKETIRGIQQAFIESPFFYEHTDKQLLDVYGVHNITVTNPSLVVA